MQLGDIMSYFGIVLTAMLTALFACFVIAATGYAIGGIKIKGISLGTAGVLVMALVYGILMSAFGKTDDAGALTTAFELGGKTVTLYNNSIKSTFSTISSLGTAMFVTAVGLIAGPKFFRNFNKKMVGYLLMGVIVIVSGAAVTIAVIKLFNTDSSMALGLMTGALTSTPGLSAAKEAVQDVGGNVDMATAGYGIAYLFGVLGVVFFVQLVPKFMKVDVEKEREKIIAANAVKSAAAPKKRLKIDTMDFFPFMLTVAIGMIIGAIKIPIGGGSYFSFGASGGTLIAGLIVGHFGHLFGIDLSVNKNTLNFFRELGLMLFLIGAGVPGGVNFMANFNWAYLGYGAIITLVPMLIGFIFGKYVFKLPVFNNLASITGGMTSTPALGTLISVAGTDEIASSYAATYPIALVLVVLVAKIVPMLM